ncbi:MAG: PEP-CTERM sorting domain-containing protein [Planctomycetota bacterium]|nr:PEP-CTERM sorting domain-containing protein [Planctomycetota bacterium]
MNAQNALKALVVVVAVSCGTLSAAPLGLTTAFPDFAVTSTVNTAYASSTQTFTLTGGLSQYSPSLGVSKVAGNGTGTGLTLTANITNAGGLVSGTLTLNGIVPQLTGAVAANLLTANLTAFGFSGSGASTVFEFKGAVTGGTYAASFGSQIGVILNPGTTTYAGNFNGNFTGSTGTVDIFTIVPEPCTLAVAGLGGLALLRRRRRA